MTVLVQENRSKHKHSIRKFPVRVVIIREIRRRNRHNPSLVLDLILEVLTYLSARWITTEINFRCAWINLLINTSHLEKVSLSSPYISSYSLGFKSRFFLKRWQCDNTLIPQHPENSQRNLYSSRIFTSNRQNEFQFFFIRKTKQQSEILITHQTRNITNWKAQVQEQDWQQYSSTVYFLTNMKKPWIFSCLFKQKDRTVLCSAKEKMFPNPLAPFSGYSFVMQLNIWKEVQFCNPL